MQLQQFCSSTGPPACAGHLWTSLSCCYCCWPEPAASTAGGAQDTSPGCWSRILENHTQRVGMVPLPHLCSSNPFSPTATPVVVFRTPNPPPPGCRTPLLKEMVQVQWVCIFYHILLPWPLTCPGWNLGQGVKPGMQPCNADIPGHTTSPQRLPWGSGRWDVLLTLQAFIKRIYHLFYLHKFTVLLENCHCHRGYRQGWFLRLRGSGNPPPLSMMPGPFTWLFAHFWGKNPTRTMKA